MSPEKMDPGQLLSHWNPEAAAKGEENMIQFL